MEISYPIQIALNGLVLGSYYSLIAAGFTLVFGICAIFNFAHGELYMLGGYAAFFLLDRFGVNYPSAIVLVAIATALVGMVMERVFYRPVYGTMYASFMVALGLQLVVSGATLVIFGEQIKKVPSTFQGTATILGATISWERVVVILAGTAVVGGLLFFIHHTKMGRELRAVAQNPEAAALQGINITSSRARAFMIGAALAGIAATLVVPIFYLDPFIGGPALMLLDEPTMGLSPLLCDEISSIIQMINTDHNTSTLLVEQNAMLALGCSQYSYVMEQGKVVLEGESSQLLDDERVRASYLGI